MQVLHIIPSLDPRGGGPVTALKGLTRALTRQSVHVTVATCVRPGDQTETFEALTSDGVAIHALPVHNQMRKLDSSGRGELAELIEQADVCHLHGIWESILHISGATSRKLDTPYIVRPCGMLDAWSLRRKWLKKKVYYLLKVKRFLTQASLLHYTSRFEQESTARLGLPPASVVLPNGVDVDRCRTAATEHYLRKRFPQLQNAKVIVFLGRLHPGKGMEYLMPAMVHVKDTDAHLVAIGPDSQGYRGKLESAVNDLALKSRVTFAGPIHGDELFSALHDADIFCLPSEHENFGIAVVEALACGLPALVSTGVAIHKEICDAGVGGAFELNPIEIADEINKWLGIPPEQRREIGKKAASFAEECFSWDQIGSAWLDCYRKLCLHSLA